MSDPLMTSLLTAISQQPIYDRMTLAVANISSHPALTPLHQALPSPNQRLHTLILFHMSVSSARIGRCYTAVDAEDAAIPPSPLTFVECVCLVWLSIMAKHTAAYGYWVGKLEVLVSPKGRVHVAGCEWAFGIGADIVDDIVVSNGVREEELKEVMMEMLVDRCFEGGVEEWEGYVELAARNEGFRRACEWYQLAV